MDNKRIYDIIGTVIATLIAAVIINQFPAVVAILNSETTWKTYIILILILVIAFFAFIIINYFSKKRERKVITEKEQMIEKLKNAIEKLKSEYIELEETASIDLQTGALNKNQIDRIIHERIDSSKTNNSTFCVILADIDEFKRINDTYDHESGNFVLKQMADLIRPRSKDDYLIRYGGDEFLIVTKVGENTEGGYGFSERIRKEVQSHNFVVDYNSTERVRITLSCGVTAYRGEEDSKEDVLDRAAQALKAAKSKRADGKIKNFVHVIE